jgi:hypothetical protein
MKQEDLLTACSIHGCDWKPLKIISEAFGRHPTKHSSTELQMVVILGTVTHFEEDIDVTTSFN